MLLFLVRRQEKEDAKKFDDLKDKIFDNIEKMFCDTEESIKDEPESIKNAFATLRNDTMNAIGFCEGGFNMGKYIGNYEETGIISAKTLANLQDAKEYLKSGQYCIVTDNYKEIPPEILKNLI